MSGAPFILMQLKAKHFAGASFGTKANGIFYNAIRDTLLYKYCVIVEKENFIQVAGNEYSFTEEYTRQMYETDSRVATENAYNDIPIRQIKLKKIINVTIQPK